MKILHTSDWHLGKKLETFSRFDEQKAVMAEICDIADAQKVDAIVIAGDIFDTFNPPVEAIELFYHSLRKLSVNGQRPVVVIAGNHDSADRIEAPDPLARELGIIFVGYPNSKINTFQLETGLSLIKSDQGFLEFKLPNQELLRILVTPYANEIRLKKFLGVEDSEHELRQILGDNWQSLADKYCDDQGVNLLLAHLFFAKKGQQLQQEPDDEKPILHIGGAPAIYTKAIPKQIQYSALGHLHRRQTIDNSQAPVVYCGTPIAYSFAETNQEKYVVIVSIKARSKVKENAKAQLDYIELKKGKKLLRQSFTSVASAIDWLRDNQNTLVEITLQTDCYLKAAEKKSLYDTHSGIVNIIPQVSLKNNTNLQAVTQINLEDNIVDLFKQFFAAKHASQQPNEELLDLFTQVLSQSNSKVESESEPKSDSNIE